MTTKLKRLSLCILFIGLNACSSKDKPESDPAVDAQTIETMVEAESVAEKPTVIVPKEQISPDQNLKEFELSDIQAQYRIRYPTMWETEKFRLSAFVDNYDLIHPQLHLGSDQIFVIGNREHSSRDNDLFIDLTSDEYFKYSNNLAINYIRYLKAPKIEPKQEFEKSHAYEERVKQAKQNAETTAVDYDLKLLEQALNRSVGDIYFAVSDASYEYDADQEQMHIHLAFDVMESDLVIKVQPDLAKQIAANFNQLRLGFVFNFKNNQLNLDGIFFYLKKVGNPDRHSSNVEEVMYVSPVFKPISFKQKSAIELQRQFVTDAYEHLKTMPFKDVSLSPVWQFKFGLEQYQSPESLMQKYPKKEIPKEPEEFKYLGEG
ncbi:hypothetical protein [Acinetobacter beijerinckii]|uniref:hypothetical protein n=1 Tax=Acinetobacter beijerinckii TaxID=262668 RepID=UPI0030087C13